MKNFLMPVIVTLGTFAHTAAHAADYDFSADPMGAYDWSGPYFGVKFGGAIEGNSDGAFPAATDEVGLEGILGGTMAGYNLQYDNFVFGIDNDMSLTDIDGSTSVGGQSGKVSLDVLSTMRGRVGYAYDRFLPYVTGGLATARADFSLDGAGSDNNEWFLGYAVGAGVEWAVTDTIAARIEYQFIDLGSESINIGGNRSSASIDELHIVRAGVSLKTGFIVDAIMGR